MLESCNGYAWLNLTCCLGRPHESHVRKKSKYREDKDNARAAAFNEKVRKKNDENVDDATDAKDAVDAKDDQIDAVTEEVKDVDSTYEGFVDCSISVESGAMCEYDFYNVEKHEEVNEALNGMVKEFLSKEFPEVEISKIDFSTRYTNEWFYPKHGPVRAVARDHKLRVNYKQKNSSVNFSDAMKNAMKAQTLIPVPEGKGGILLGKKEKARRKNLIHLEQLVLVENDR